MKNYELRGVCTEEIANKYNVNNILFDSYVPELCED